MADEGELRDALRGAWANWCAPKFGPLIWVEHARGGTVGAPDVMMPLGERGYCPLELKWWAVDREGHPVMTSRPAQKRFHLLAAQAGMRTAYLAQVANGDYVMLPGWCLKREEKAGQQMARVNMRYVAQMTMVRELLLDETFWRKL